MSDFKNIQQRESGLKQELGARQMSMIALGGAIGTGLFLGSKFAIGFAGPSVIISYAIGGLIALLLMGALAEMTVAHATSGSFGAYAEYYVSPLIGFLVRYLYWSCIVLAVGTEVTAIGEYMQFWFADIPQWIWIVLFSAVLIGVNMFNVKAFGTMEYWFSTIKVFAIVAFIIMAAYVVFGSGNPDYGFHNYTSGGGFLPNGFSGMWFAVIVSIFSYLSIEMIAIAAGEAENPAVAVKKAFRVTIVRLFVFYIATLGLIVAIAPMDKILSGGSPFVTVMQVINIPGADSVLNFVVIIAALSAMNSQLYVSSRMMFSLSRAGDAPKILGKVRANGSPVNALLLSTSGIAVATVVYVLFPEQAFTLMISLSMFGAMATWLLIFVTHWFFRKRMQAEGTKLSFTIPGFPVGTILGGGLMVAIMLTTLWVESFKMTLVFGVPFVLAAIAIFYLTRSRRARSQALNADQVEDEITGTVVKRVP